MLLDRGGLAVYAMVAAEAQTAGDEVLVFDSQARGKDILPAPTIEAGRGYSSRASDAKAK
jgi:hypothetical protein